MNQQLILQTIECSRIANNLIERGLRDIRDMSEEIERWQDLVAYGEALKFIKPFKSDKGESIASR